MKKICFFALFSVIAFTINAQPVATPPNVSNAETSTSALPRNASIQGKVIEAGSNTPLEYAQIAIYSASDSALIAGGIAGLNGEFNISGLRPGQYYVDAKFIGFESTIIDNVTIDRNISTIELGTVELNPASENLGEVNVTAQDRPIVYNIDKRVIDPAHFPVAAGGTAIDILAQTPSVVVDVEGNVTMRGSSNFTVYIDGRPTPFDPADALDQIPASSIRNIEIITNPSARFDPDGNAGIININTRRSRLLGVSGIVNASADTNGSLSGDFLLNYRMEKFNFFINANRSDRRRVGDFYSYNEAYADDTVFTRSEGSTIRGGTSWSVRTGFDYFINDYNTLTFNATLNGRNRFNDREADFHEYSTSGFDLFSRTITMGDATRNTQSYSLDYRRTFDTDGQEFTAYAYFENGGGEDYSEYNQYDINDIIFGGQQNWETYDRQRFRFRADYVHPFNARAKIETGYQLRMNHDFKWSDVFWYDTPQAYTPTEFSEYYIDSDFKRDIHALYSTFSNSGEVVGYQLGLRAEYTDREIDFSGSEDIYNINRWDFFPSAHLSFQLPLEQQLTTSYTRRINRPRNFFLEPFVTYSDAYNVRIGNPAIEPEYVNSYEIGYQKQIGSGFLSAELYHRNTTNKIERLTSVYEGNVMLQSFDNIGEDFSTGLEFMLNVNPFSWWRANLMGNVYHYRVEGVINGRDIGQESNNWNSRISNTFTIGKNTRLQVDGMYNSPTVTAQGRREGFLFTNLALRQEFLNNQLNVTLSVRDVLGTAKFGFEASGPDFYSERRFEMQSPVFGISVQYRINNYRQQRRERANGNGEGGGEMDMDMM